MVGESLKKADKELVDLGRFTKELANKHDFLEDNLRVIEIRWESLENTIYSYMINMRV